MSKHGGAQEVCSQQPMGREQEVMEDLSETKHVSYSVTITTVVFITHFIVELASNTQ